MRKVKCQHEWADINGVQRCARCHVPLSQRKPRKTRPGVKQKASSEYQAPALDAETALQFAKLLHVGIPAQTAVQYCAPNLDPARVPDTAKLWLRAPATFAAVNVLNRAKWEDLDNEARMRIALDRHLSELAYYLYTHSFEEAQGPELTRMREARSAITSALEGTKGADNPFDKFMQDVIEGKQKLATPPSLVAAKKES